MGAASRPRWPGINSCCYCMASWFFELLFACFENQKSMIFVDVKAMWKIIAFRDCRVSAVWNTSVVSGCLKCAEQYSFDQVHLERISSSSSIDRSKIVFSTECYSFQSLKTQKNYFSSAVRARERAPL